MKYMQFNKERKTNPPATEEQKEIINKFISLAKEQEPKEFIKQRKYNPEIIKKLNIGFCNIDVMNELMQTYDKDKLKELGFISQGHFSYSNRVIIPHSDYYFSARSLNKSDKKNLFPKGISKEPFFIKNNSDILYIVEGETDLIALYHFFQDKDILSLGGVLSQKSLAISKDYDKVVICFDNDDAGKEGLKKAIPSIQNDNIYNLIVPKYKDIDEFFRNEGLEKLKTLKEVKIELEDYKADTKNRIKDLSYRTKHLSHFKILEKAFQLYGDEYKPLMKARWYQFLGIVLKDKLIRYKTTRVDTRVNLLIALKSGRGKKNLKLIGKKIFEKLGMVVEQPTSLHPEQLVGKVVEVGKGKNKERIANRGYFDSDLIQIDEALELMTSKEQNITETRQYICVATDPLGDNLISKKLVEHLNTEKLSYNPKCSMVLFFQPFPIPDIVVTSGFIRRFLTLYVLTQSDVEDIFEQRLNNKGNLDHSCSVFVDYLSSVKNLKGDWEFEEDCSKTFKELATHLVYLGRDFSKKGCQFTNIMEQTLLDLLIKFSCILAGSYGQIKVTSNHIRLAFMDLVELFYSSLDFVNDLVMGKIDYGSKWKTKDTKKQSCLEWLFEKQAINEDKSNVTIDDFKHRIMEVFGIKDDMAQKKYSKMKEDELIESKQIGQHSSKVWLAFNPKEDNIQGSKGCKGGNAYKCISDDIKNILGTIQPLLPLQPSTEKVASDSLIVEKETIQDKFSKEKLLSILKKQGKIKIQSIYDTFIELDYPEEEIKKIIEYGVKKGDWFESNGWLNLN